MTLHWLLFCIDTGGYTGGEVLTVLHSYVMNSIKDAKTQDLCNHLALCASRPYFDILQDWIYKGQIKACTHKLIGNDDIISIWNTFNSVYNDYVYNDIPVIEIEFHGPGHDASI